MQIRAVRISAIKSDVHECVIAINWRYADHFIIAFGTHYLYHPARPYKRVSHDQYKILLASNHAFHEMTEILNKYLSHDVHKRGDPRRHRTKN